LRKQTFPLILITCLLFLAACGGTDADPTATPTAPPFDEPVAATETPSSGYPAAQPTPTLSRSTDGYPAPRPTPTLTDAYAALDPVWVVKPAGMQCQEYTVDPAAASNELAAAGIQVLDLEMAVLAVCEACDTCPSSEHYRFLIPSADLAAAAELGWSEE
jgi:hypothetical protein